MKSAINNIKRRLKTENYNLMIIDILENPQVAELVGIVATPLLMRTIPKPVRRFVGDFTDSKLDILT
ncbi:MAG: circadian clock KaiB family protein [Candidatus Lokiarchaeota archaeon]